MKTSPGAVAVRKHHKVVKALWLCIGCGQVRATERRRYCRTCRERLKRGEAVDVDDLPTWREFLRLRRTLAWLR